MHVFNLQTHRAELSRQRLQERLQAGVGHRLLLIDHDEVQILEEVVVFVTNEENGALLKSMGCFSSQLAIAGDNESDLVKSWTFVTTNQPSGYTNEKPVGS